MNHNGIRQDLKDLSVGDMPALLADKWAMVYCTTDPVQRDETMRSLYEDGFSLEVIGRVMGFTAPSVRSILDTLSSRTGTPVKEPRYFTGMNGKEYLNTRAVVAPPAKPAPRGVGRPLAPDLGKATRELENATDRLARMDLTEDQMDTLVALLARAEEAVLRKPANTKPPQD